jgi:hypothetical protein
MIEIVQYEPHHIDEIMKHPRKWEIKTSQHPDWDKWKDIWRNGGPAYSLRADGEVIAAAGVLVEDGVGEAWAVISDCTNRYAKSIYAAIKRGLDHIPRESKINEIQMFVDPEFDQGKRMAVHLGFTEGELGIVCGMNMIRFWRKC